MMTHLEMLEYMRDSIEAYLTPKYAAAGIDPVQDWLTQTPYDAERIQFSIFTDGGESNDEFEIYSFLSRLTLPREDVPEKYLTDFIASFREAINPNNMGLTALAEIEYGILYPGNLPEGGYGSFIDVNIQFNKTLDDCY